MPIPPPELSVFDYAEPVPFLRDVLEDKKRRGRGFSLRAWSRQLGFRTPSYLSAVLAGDRRLKPELAGRLATNLRLEASEAERFALLVLRSNAESPADRERYDRLLRRVVREPRSLRLAEDRFALVSEWYHWALLEMVAQPDFRPDPEWLARRLGQRVRPDLIESALRRLLRLKLVRRRKDGTWVRIEGETLAGDAVPSSHVRAHHRQFLDRAKAALEEQRTEERDFRGSTFLFGADRIEEARALIRDCHRQLRALASEGAGDQVYRFNTQLFRITERSE